GKTSAKRTTKLPSSSPSPSPSSIRRHNRRNPPRNRRCWTVFDRTSNLSFSVVRPANRTSKVSAGFESTVPATFLGMSKNKSCFKWGVLPKLGVWAGGLEFFRPLEIDQATHALPTRVAAHGQIGGDHI
ncbi:unnamed protein product, partial [Prunus brigantina]